MTEPGRWCALNGVPECAQLTPGEDFRRPQYRRAVFLRFYEYHLRYRAHPGCVYYLMPALQSYYGWTVEQAYWWAFINGNTQNPVTTTIIWEQFASVDAAGYHDIAKFVDQNWKKLEFDTDRRYWKARFWEAVETYQHIVQEAGSQAELFQAFQGEFEHDNFARLWAFVRQEFLGFGRLSAWSYIEYLRILGLPVQPYDLMLHDLDGSKSHRNGLCKVLGRDDLDWRDGPSPYTPAILEWLDEEAYALLQDAQAFVSPDAPYRRDVTFLTLESALCTFKSWHRPNRRYPNVYNDMLHDRIKKAEREWGPLTRFWQIRQQALPSHLRLEDNPLDVGVRPEKQNYYLTHGCPVMMSKEYPCFENDYDARLQ